MNFFDHKDLGNHLLQLCPKVVKHPVYSACHVLSVTDSTPIHPRKQVTHCLPLFLSSFPETLLDMSGKYESLNQEVSHPGKMFHSISIQMLALWDVATFMLGPYVSFK